MTPLPPIGQHFHRTWSFLNNYLYNRRKYYRLSQFNHLFDTRNTLSSLWNVLRRRVEYFYNDDRNHFIDAILCTNIITHQQKIGWNPFVRGWVHHSLIETMIYRYRKKKRKNTHQLTDIYWTKEVIEFMLETHITKWNHR